MATMTATLTLMAPRQNPYSRAATRTLRVRLNRDERGLVVAEETWEEDQRRPEDTQHSLV